MRVSSRARDIRGQRRHTSSERRNTHGQDDALAHSIRRHENTVDRRGNKRTARRRAAEEQPGTSRGPAKRARRNHVADAGRAHHGGRRSLAISHALRLQDAGTAKQTSHTRTHLARLGRPHLWRSTHNGVNTNVSSNLRRDARPAPTPGQSAKRGRCHVWTGAHQGGEASTPSAVLPLRKLQPVAHIQNRSLRQARKDAQKDEKRECRQEGHQVRRL